MQRILLVRTGLLWMVCCYWIGSAISAAEPVPQVVRAKGERTGEVQFVPTAQEAETAARFRLAEHRFQFEQIYRPTTRSTLELSEVTFPSPVKTQSVANNTVHCEFYCPVRPAGVKVPGVIVLHILGGDFPLARAFCYHLADRGIAALFLKMPYYGPRREEGSALRMVSADPHATADGMTQAVLDIRRGAAWLGQQPEVDPNQLGIMGVSLGGIVSALAAEQEPQFAKVGLLMAGGDVALITLESKELAKYRKQWEAKGLTLADLQQILRPVDPVTYAARLKNRKVLMLNAKRDEVIPPACTLSLWEAAGRPEIHWWDAGHYTAAFYLPQGLDRMARWFAPEGAAATPSSGPAATVKSPE